MRWWWRENNINVAVVVVVVVVVYSFTIYEAVLKKKVECRVDVASM